MFKEYSQYDAMELAKPINDGQISPKEVLLVAIERADRLNPSPNAIFTALMRRHWRRAIHCPKERFLACHFC